MAHTHMRLLTLLLALVLSAESSPAGFLDRLFHRDVSVIINTDMTPEGALLRTPSKENPVYYVAVSAGYQDLGGVMGGDKLPQKEAMHRFIAQALAKQGYLPATKDHDPSQILIFAWGTLYRQLLPNVSNPDLPDVQTNRNQMMAFLGGRKLGLVSDTMQIPGYDFVPGLTFTTPDAEMIKDTASDDLYMTAIASYDLLAASKKKRKLLWVTRISCPCAGLVMADTLPKMLAIATPHIGRETVKPVWVDASDRYKGDVKIGDATVEAYLDSAAYPVIEHEGTKKKKKK